MWTPATRLLDKKEKKKKLLMGIVFLFIIQENMATSINRVHFFISVLCMVYILCLGKQIYLFFIYFSCTILEL